MKVRWHKRELNALFLEVCDESLRALAVQELYLGGETPVRKKCAQTYLFVNQVLLLFVT